MYVKSTYEATDLGIKVGEKLKLTLPEDILS